MNFPSFRHSKSGIPIEKLSIAFLFMSFSSFIWHFSGHSYARTHASHFHYYSNQLTMHTFCRVYLFHLRFIIGFNSQRDLVFLFFYRLPLLFVLSSCFLLCCRITYSFLFVLLLIGSSLSSSSPSSSSSLFRSHSFAEYSAFATLPLLTYILFRADLPSSYS